ncbi:MAG: hypothetical protein IIX86_09025 [Clostridia bacterium]|nr:hypothetical protein [Clostridia bacterium]
MLKKNKKYLFDKDEEIFDSDAEQAAPDGKYDAAIDAYAKYRSAAMQRDKAYSDIVNRKDFSYNVNNDAMYDQLVREYTEGASRAAEDAMGRAAAMTGGYGNSYAQQVSQQTFQDYMGGLDAEADKLYDRALDRYLLQGEALADKYALASDMADQKYAEYEAILGAQMEGTTTGAVAAEKSPIDVDKYEEAFSDMTTQEEIANYLEKRIATGAITKEDALILLDQYATDLPTEKSIKDESVSNRNYEDYEVVDDGGFNIFGMDRDAKVRYTFENGDTEEVTLAELYKRLQKEGKSKKQAKEIVLELQEQLGISTPGWNIY